MTPYMPSELVDAILSHVLHSATLSACTLVCRDWVDVSRKWLFEYITIHGPETYDLFIDQVFRQEHMRPWLTLTRFVVYSQQDSGIHARVHRFFHELAGHLPALDTLVLGNLHWEQYAVHRSAHLALSRFHTIRELWLVDCAFPSFAVLRRMLSALPSLQSVVFRDVTWSNDSAVTENALFQSRPKLDTLTLLLHSENDARTIIRWITRTPSLSTLHYLTLYSMHAGVEWKGIGSCITTMDLRITPSDVGPVTPSKLPLSPFSQLKILIIRFDSDVNWQHLASVITGVSRLLEELVITFEDPNGRAYTDSLDIQTDGLELLDPILAHGNFPHLKCVDICIKQQVPALLDPEQGRLADTAVDETFQKKLPQLCGRGVMKAVVWRVLDLNAGDLWSDARKGFGRKPLYGDLSPW